MTSAWGYAWGRAWRNAWGAAVAAITLPAPERIARPGVEARQLAVAQSRHAGRPVEVRLAALAGMQRVARVPPSVRELVMPAHQRLAAPGAQVRHVAAPLESRTHRLSAPRIAAARLERRQAAPIPDSRTAAGAPA